MLSEYKTKTNVGVGLGLTASIIARFVLMPKGGAYATAGLFVLIPGMALFIWGCCCYAKGKGLHPALGLFGLLSIIGLIVLVCLPDRCKDGVPVSTDVPPPLPTEASRTPPPLPTEAPQTPPPLPPGKQ